MLVKTWAKGSLFTAGWNVTSSVSIAVSMVYPVSQVRPRESSPKGLQALRDTVRSSSLQPWPCSQQQGNRENVSIDTQCSSVEENRIMSFAGTWMQIGLITACKLSWSQKNRACFLSFAVPRMYRHIKARMYTRKETSRLSWIGHVNELITRVLAEGPKRPESEVGGMCSVAGEKDHTPRGTGGLWEPDKAGKGWSSQSLWKEPALTSPSLWHGESGYRLLTSRQAGCAGPSH